MLVFIQPFLFGLLISFLGQLPLANLNILATQLAVQEGIKSAWRLGVGAALVEVIYLRISLTGMDWVLQHQTLFITLSWFTVAFFFILGAVILIRNHKKGEEKKGILISSKMNRFLMGLSLSAINPVQIPFWFTWSMLLINNGAIQPVNWQYNTFTIGAGFGTLFGIAVYIYGGSWAIKKMDAKNRQLNIFMGCVFILTAIIQLYKLINAPWTNEIVK